MGIVLKYCKSANCSFRAIYYTLYLIILFQFISPTLSAQPWLKRVDSVKVTSDNNLLQFPWAGGLNFCQFSQIDLNFDGYKDLFVFDRTGNRISTFLNDGQPNVISYTFAPNYIRGFPALHDWVLLVDYNCDGKEDIFSYSNLKGGGGMLVYRNDSDPLTGLKFTLVKEQIRSFYYFSTSNLYVSSIDIPAITDIDNDGDLDVITFGNQSNAMEYHKNLSKEMFGNCDSLKFQLSTACWGNFAESPTDNNVVLGITCKEKPHDPDSLPKILHTGSCELCLDMNGDGAKEIILGDVSYNTLTMAINSGTPSVANMTNKQINFPQGTTPVDLPIFPCAFAVDVDNNGLTDFIASPNTQNASENYKSVWLYKNTGTANNFIFTFQKNNFLQDDMIDVGEGAYPVFFDYNADGLKDLLIANYKYYDTSKVKSNLVLFENKGTINKPMFNLVTRDYLSISTSTIIGPIPTIGDIDADGDVDLIIGDQAGNIYVYTNTAGANNIAAFTLTQSKLKDNLNTIIDIGSNAAPQLVDVDKDGKLDMLIGAQNGRVSYYRNTGTTTVPIFTKITNTFGNVSTVRKSTYSLSGYSTPFLFNQGGSSRLVIGSESGYLYFYSNIDGNLNGNFTLVDSSYQYIHEGLRIAPTAVDINNDGLIDFAIGNYAGGVALYYGQTTPTSIDNEKTITEQVMKIFPNPASNYITIQFNSFTNDNKIIVSNLLGEQIKQIIITANDSYQLDVGGFTDGVYFITLQTSNHSSTQKIVISKK